MPSKKVMRYGLSVMILNEGHHRIICPDKERARLKAFVRIHIFHHYSTIIWKDEAINLSKLQNIFTVAVWKELRFIISMEALFSYSWRSALRQGDSFVDARKMEA